MNEKVLKMSLGILVLGLAGAFWFFQPTGKEVISKYDEFAKCLAQKGVVMYGAEWCLHCQSQKKLFDSSFNFVSYIECPKDPKKCLTAGITVYPTWIFSDGKKLEGEQSLEKLSESSSCALLQK